MTVIHYFPEIWIIETIVGHVHRSFRLAMEICVLLRRSKLFNSVQIQKKLSLSAEFIFEFKMQTRPWVRFTASTILFYHQLIGRSSQKVISCSRWVISLFITHFFLASSGRNPNQPAKGQACVWAFFQASIEDTFSQNLMQGYRYRTSGRWCWMKGRIKRNLLRFLSVFKNIRNKIGISRSAHPKNISSICVLPTTCTHTGTITMSRRHP